MKILLLAKIYDSRYISDQHMSELLSYMTIKWVIIKSDSPLEIFVSWKGTLARWKTNVIWFHQATPSERVYIHVNNFENGSRYRLRADFKQKACWSSSSYWKIEAWSSEIQTSWTSVKESNVPRPRKNTCSSSFLPRNTDKKVQPVQIDFGQFNVSHHHPCELFDETF